MIIVKVTTCFPQWPFARQTPGESGVWGRYKFLINQDVPECDCWVVFDELIHEEATLCSPANTILITGEPPQLKDYPNGFVSQFGTVVTQQRYDIKHPNIIFKVQGHPWHIGRKTSPDHINLGFRLGYDELKSISDIPKTKCISIISSSKQRSEGHRARYKFVQRLKNYFGSELDVFGRGVHDIEDKWDGIADYKYHIVIENIACGDWVTEKLWDAYLGLSFPFYYGAPNITDYFPQEALQTIDIRNVEAAVTTIKKAIDNNTYEKSLTVLKVAKNLVLDKYNFFPLIAELCDNLLFDRAKEKVMIRPSIVFRPKPAKQSITKRILKKIVRTMKQEQASC